MRESTSCNIVERSMGFLNDCVVVWGVVCFFMDRLLEWDHVVIVGFQEGFDRLFAELVLQL